MWNCSQPGSSGTGGEALAKYTLKLVTKIVIKTVKTSFFFIIRWFKVNNINFFLPLQVINLLIKNQYFTLSDVWKYQYEVRKDILRVLSAKNAISILILWEWNFPSEIFIKHIITKNLYEFRQTIPRNRSYTAIYHLPLQACDLRYHIFLIDQDLQYVTCDIWKTLNYESVYQHIDKTDAGGVMPLGFTIDDLKYMIFEGRKWF